MTALGLALAAWLVGGALDAPVDAFLPLAIAIGSRRGASWDARVGLAVAVAALTAPLCGDALLERAVRHAAAAVAAGRLADVLRDGAVARATAAGVALLAINGAEWLLFLGGTLPRPAATVAGLAATVAWTALHGALCTRPRLPEAR